MTRFWAAASVLAFPLALALIAGVVLVGNVQAAGQIVNVQASDANVAPGETLTIDFAYGGPGSPSVGAVIVDGTIVRSSDGLRNVGGLIVLVERTGTVTFRATITVPPDFLIGSLIEVDLSIFTGQLEYDAHTPMSTFYAVVPNPLTMLVNSNDDADDGSCDASHCSLREAIQAANANTPALDTILFAPETLFTDTNRIEPQTPLPHVLDDLFIDGDGRVEIHGGDLPGSVGIGDLVLEEARAFAGLVATDVALTLTGLALNGFPGDAIILDGGGPYRIEESHFGTDVDGIVDLANGEADIRIQTRPGQVIELDVELRGNTHAGGVNVDGGGRIRLNVPTIRGQFPGDTRFELNAGAQGQYIFGSEFSETDVGADFNLDVDVGEEIDLILRGSYRDGGLRVTAEGGGTFNFVGERLVVRDVAGIGIDVTLQGDVNGAVLLRETDLSGSLGDNLRLLYDATGGLTVDLSGLISDNAGRDGTRFEVGLFARQSVDATLNDYTSRNSVEAGLTFQTEVVEGVSVSLTVRESLFEGGQRAIDFNVDVTGAAIAIGTELFQLFNDGNTFIGTSGSAIRLRGGQASINGDRFTNTQSAIELRHGATATITANAIEDSVGDAIRLRDSSSATVTGNTISGSGGSAIAAEATAVLTESDNVFAANAGGDIDRNAPPRRSVALRPQWNLIGWTGATTPVTEAVETLAGSLDAVFTWDAAQVAFRSFAPAAPPFLNSLTELASGDGVWLRIEGTSALEWEQPQVVGAQSVPLLAGFNLVVWMGPDGTPVADAVAGLEAALVSLFTYDSLSQRFLAFLPALPAALNSLTVLQHGDGVWLEVIAAVTWDQPAP